MSIDERDPVLERLDRIEAALESLVRQRTVKDQRADTELGSRILHV